MPSTRIPATFGVSLVVLMVAVFVASYCTAWYHGHIDGHVIPYISDLGVHTPEKYIFRQLLNMAVFAGMVVMTLRYVVTQVDPLERRLDILSKVACSLGILALFGMSLVANFQECNDLVGTVHSVGAGVLFFSGTVYTIIDSALTLLLVWQRDGSVNGVSMRWYGWVRPVLAVIAFGNMILGIVGKTSSPNRHCIHSYNETDVVLSTTSTVFFKHDQSLPNQSYTESAVAEWLLGAVFILYNATFIPEFLNHPMTLSAVRRQADRVLMLHPDAVRVLPAEPHEGSRLLS